MHCVEGDERKERLFMVRFNERPCLLAERFGRKTFVVDLFIVVPHRGDLHLAGCLAVALDGVAGVIEKMDAATSRRAVEPVEAMVEGKAGRFWVPIRSTGVHLTKIAAGVTGCAQPLGDGDGFIRQTTTAAIEKIVPTLLVAAGDQTDTRGIAYRAAGVGGRQIDSLGSQRVETRRADVLF